MKKEPSFAFLALFAAFFCIAAFTPPPLFAGGPGIDSEESQAINSAFKEAYKKEVNFAAKMFAAYPSRKDADGGTEKEITGVDGSSRKSPANGNQEIMVADYDSGLEKILTTFKGLFNGNRNSAPAYVEASLGDGQVMACVVRTKTDAPRAKAVFEKVVFRPDAGPVKPDRQLYIPVQGAMGALMKALGGFSDGDNHMDRTCKGAVHGANCRGDESAKKVTKGMKKLAQTRDEQQLDGPKSVKTRPNKGGQNKSKVKKVQQREGEECETQEFWFKCGGGSASSNKWIKPPQYKNVSGPDGMAPIIAWPVSVTVSPEATGMPWQR